MVNTKKTPSKKTTSSSKSSFSDKEKKTTSIKKTSKTVAPKAATTSKTPKLEKTTKASKTTSKATNKASIVAPQAQDFFKDYYKEGERIFLTAPRSYGELPDLLELQRRGYEDFISLYLPKLFSDIDNIWDIAGDKMYITISDVKVGEPMDSYETCKKKELTYGGIITAKIKLVEKIEDEKTKKISEKVHFQKKANVGILPLMTPSASYIINGVERVIISQIIRSYGIFYSKKDFRYSFKLIPENGPWLEVDVEKN